MITGLKIDPYKLCNHGQSLRFSHPNTQNNIHSLVAIQRMESDLTHKWGLGGKKEVEKQKRKKEDAGRRQREHSSKFYSLQRPFLLIFLLTIPMQTQCSSLTLTLTLSKMPFPPQFPKLCTCHFFKPNQIHSLSQPGLWRLCLSTHPNHSHPSRCSSNDLTGKACPP